MERIGVTRFLVLTGLLGLTVCLPVGLAQGLAQVPGAEISAAVNLPARNIKLEGKIFIPDRASSVRTVIVATNYTALHEGIGIQLLYARQLRATAEVCQCALLYVWLGTIRPADPSTPVAQQLWRNAAVGGGDALLLLLQRLADETGHQELKDVPLLLFGWSATASFGTTFAELHPERTVGLIRYHTHQRGMTANLSVLRNIPTLIIAGGKDEMAGVEDSEALWTSGRAVGAPWTFAIEPNGTHGDQIDFFRTADDLLAPWIAAVVRDRLSSDTTNLKPLVENTGYLGDNRSGQAAPYSSFSGNKAAASWLPDEATTRGWRNVITFGN